MVRVRLFPAVIPDSDNDIILVGAAELVTWNIESETGQTIEDIFYQVKTPGVLVAVMI